MRNLDKIFGITLNDVVSITGAGGKTSLMYLLGDNFNKSLMTTTTKLFVPKDKKLYVGDIPKEIEGSLVVAKKQIEDKLYGFTCSELKSFYSEFNYTFIEADGARMMSLKGWNANEPIICDFSNKTIGVLDITTLGSEVAETVFRVDELSKITILDNNVKIRNLVDIVLDPDGLFKNSKYKILYINKVETESYEKSVLTLIEKLMDDKRFNIDRIVYGSINDNKMTLSYAKRGIFVLASGLSTRMGMDKLSIKIDGRMLIEHTLEKLSDYQDDKYIICSNNRFDDVAKKYGFRVLLNSKFENGQSESIKKSLETDYHYYSYFLGDMPWISRSSIAEFLLVDRDVVSCINNEIITAPATLSYLYKEELLGLTGDQGAKKVLLKNMDKLTTVSLNDIEVRDVDTIEDLEDIS